MRVLTMREPNGIMGMNETDVAARYFFVIRWPDHNDDDAEGTLFLSKSAALAYAERIIRELKEAGGYDEPGLTMIVRDHDDNVVYSIPF
jgi:hypothetical protein